jgi:GNAT superfamily N-acetyltransferase
MTSISTRKATIDDYEAFARLFPEMKVDDPVPSKSRFESELMQTIIVAESDSAVCGYAYFQIMSDTLYVRNVVTDAHYRKRGVGIALMNSMADAARNAHCARWCLNVKPGNVAAVSLYEKMGMSFAYAAQSLKISWAAVKSHVDQLPATRFVVCAVPEAQDAEVERCTGLIVGQLTLSRQTPDRVQIMLMRHGQIEGAAIFHPHFPGAYPFRINDASMAARFLYSLRPFAKESDTEVNLVIEGQGEVANELLSLGAQLRMDISHYKGAIPKLGPH